MDWSAEQERALNAVAEWHRRGDQQVFRLFGYAGSGKTTLARYFAEGVKGKVYFGAFTGKAAHVLQQKGCPDATTIHSLIYRPKDRSRQRLRELEDELLQLTSELKREGLTDHDIENREAVIKLRNQIRQEEDNFKRPAFVLDPEARIRNAALVVIDECSMVDERMGQDLLSFNVPVLVLGDPAQLPPVAGEGYFTQGRPDFMLEEIHRQAADSPIIRLANEVRQGRPLPLGEYGDSRVIPWNEVNAETAQGVDQIIVGTNRLRRGTNARLRRLRGFSHPLPVEGDRLVCLRNDHEVGLLNGGIWRVNSTLETDDDRVTLDLVSEDGETNVVCEAHTAHFYGNDLPWWERKEAQEFDYGYALTCHKSQGSQWPRVLIFDQSQAFREHQRKWMYTALTRASESVIVAKP